MATAEKTALKPVSSELATRSDLREEATQDVASSLRTLLADVFTLYMKTKNFHWHMSGPHFRDYHVMLDEQSEQIFAMTDVIAERGRKLGGLTLHSIGQIAKLQRLKDNDAQSLGPHEMLAELREDNIELARLMRETHEVCADAKDVATTSILEVFIDETERRTWFLFEATRGEKG
jgi:starvation-inducible DNA-binding protein